MDRLKFKPTLVTRFRTPFLSIESPLIGSSHSFNYQGHLVQISLPKGNLRRIVESHPSLETSDPLEMHGWIENSKPKIYLLYVRDVQVTIRLKVPIVVDRQMFERPPNAYDLVSKPGMSDLPKLQQGFLETAEEAYKYWIRVLRWQSGNWAIGRTLKRDFQPGIQSYLSSTRPKKDRFWIVTPVFSAHYSSDLSRKTWKLAQGELKKSTEPPLYYEMFFDAVHHSRTGDFKRAVVDFAVCCEIYMRSKILSKLPPKVNEETRTFIDEANIRQVVTKLFPALLSTAGISKYKKISSSIHKIFDLRNDILHSGFVKGKANPDLDDLARTTQTLIDFEKNKSNWQT